MAEIELHAVYCSVQYAVMLLLQDRRRPALAREVELRYADPPRDAPVHHYASTALGAAVNSVEAAVSPDGLYVAVATSTSKIENTPEGKPYHRVMVELSIHRLVTAPRTRICAVPVNTAIPVEAREGLPYEECSVATAVCVSPTGNVYIGLSCGRIFEFDSGGAYIRAVGTAAAARQGESRLGVKALAVNAEFVVAGMLRPTGTQGGPRVDVFAVGDGRPVKSFGAAGFRSGELMGMQAVYISPDSRQFLVIDNRTLSVFDGEGSFMHHIGIDFLTLPRALAVKARGEVVVVDGTTGTTQSGYYTESGRPPNNLKQRIMVFSPDGTLLRKFGSRGHLDEQFNGVMNLSVTDTELFLLDKGRGGEGTLRVLAYVLP